VVNSYAQFYREKQLEAARQLRATDDPQAQATIRKHMMQMAGDQGYRDHWKNVHAHNDRLDATLQERGITPQEFQQRADKIHLRGDLLPAIVREEASAEISLYLTEHPEVANRLNQMKPFCKLPRDRSAGSTARKRKRQRSPCRAVVEAAPSFCRATADQAAVCQQTRQRLRSDRRGRFSGVQGQASGPRTGAQEIKMKGDQFFWRSYLSGPPTLMSLSGFAGRVQVTVGGEQLECSLTASELRECFGFEVENED
jgi:hypothetical protein